MWCNKCNIETNDTICPLCGAETIEDLPVEIYHPAPSMPHDM